MTNKRHSLIEFVAPALISKVRKSATLITYPSRIRPRSSDTMVLLGDPLVNAVRTAQMQGTAQGLVQEEDLTEFINTAVSATIKEILSEISSVANNAHKEGKFRDAAILFNLIKDLDEKFKPPHHEASSQPSLIDNESGNPSGISSEGN